MTQEGHALDWDDEFVEDNGFTLLEPGTYQFQVVDVRRERYEGGDKIGPCPRAVVVMSVMTDTGLATIEESLLLHTKVEFRIARFFEALGYTKDPETGKVPVKWNDVVGKTGWMELGIRTYPKKDGSEGKANQVNEFILPSDATPAQASIPVPEQPVQPTPNHATYQM